MKDYSTQRISPDLMDEIIEALQHIRGYGSVEIFVQDNSVVQIVERNIKKTNNKNSNIRVSKTA